MVDTIDGGPPGPQPAPITPRRRRHPLRYAIIAVLCIGAVAWMLVLMQRNVVFFKTVSQAVADRTKDGTHTLRIGGAVLPGTIKHTADGADFDLTEGGQTVVVDHSGTQPPLFQDCAPVVAVGHWQGTTFISHQIIIKHGNQYQPPAHAAVRCPAEPSGVR
jgi:cytochrome c-type biogenesis protein CcmE